MLAIVIPYYKLSFFDETLQSLASQINQRFKVYIGDDASPENPYDLLEKYKGKFDFIFHRFETNLGSISLTQQWERCIALSGNEEWIMILGDDDVLGENVVEEFYGNLPEIEQEGINVVRFATQVLNEEGNTISDVFEHQKLEKATDAFWRRFKGKTRSSLSEYVFSRASFTKFGFKDYPLAWHSDDMAWLEFSRFEKILSINTDQVYIRESVKSISGKKDNVELKELADIQFYKDIVNENLFFFKKEVRFSILLKLEVILKRKRELSNEEWTMLFWGYAKDSSILLFMKWFRRLIISKYK